MSFDTPTNFHEASGIKQVVFGEGRPLTERELNELQEIQNLQHRNVIKDLHGDNSLLPFSDYAVSYNNGVFSIANAKAIVDGEEFIIDYPPLTITAAEGDTIYLDTWVKQIDEFETVKRYGGQHTHHTVPNNMYDSRIGMAPSRRNQKQFNLSKTNTTSGHKYLLLGRILNGQFVSSIQLSKVGNDLPRKDIGVIDGTQIVQGGKVASLADVSIGGNTLVSLGNSEVEQEKYYVNADPKTNLKLGKDVMTGVSKLARNIEEFTTKATFVGKVLGSTIENPHSAKYGGANTLALPANFTSENIPPGDISYLDGRVQQNSISTNGSMAQQLFSFNVIEQVEREIGQIPRSTMAEKVQWIKDNVEKLSFSHYGYGTSPNGGSLKLTCFHTTNNAWNTWSNSHNNLSVTKISYGLNLTSGHRFPDAITNDGFLHFLAYTEASNGVTPSVVYTDYVELEISLRKEITAAFDFTGKVRGSLTENSSVSKQLTASSLQLPTVESFVEIADYSKISALDGNAHTVTTTANGAIAQQLFSFDIIKLVDGMVGIPKTLLADKIAWLKENLSSLTFYWYGYGSSVGGFKANLSIYNDEGNVWSNPSTKTTDGFSALAFGVANPFIRIANTGHAHFLVSAEASNGTVPSVIHTDFVKLEIRTKRGEKLAYTPQITRIANFEGKLTGSTVEIPHRAFTKDSDTLLTPSSSAWNELQNSAYSWNSYNCLYKTDTNFVHNTINEQGKMSQQLFSFNLIEEVERNIGKIPASNVAGKVAWLKANVQRMDIRHYGYGTNPNGSLIKFTVFLADENTWNGFGGHNRNEVYISSASIMESNASAKVSKTIDNSGFFHCLVAADASDGVKPSVVYTDYVSLEITLKRDANIQQPLIPFYEVPKAEYDKILVSWNEAEVRNRYPKVRGMKHLENPYIEAEGENLLPPFNEWRLHSEFKILSPYEGELKNARALWLESWVDISCKPLTTYTFSADPVDGEDPNLFNYAIREFDQFGVQVGNVVLKRYTGVTFTTSSNTVYIRVFTTNNLVDVPVKYKNPILTLGSTPKPFVPRNTSYLAAKGISLGKIGDYLDRLYSEGGDWKVYKSVVNTEVVSMSFASNYKNHKVFGIGITDSIKNSDLMRFVTEDGKVSKRQAFGLFANSLNGNYIGYNESVVGSGDGSVAVALPNSLTGFSPSYTPVVEECLAFVKGWKVKTSNTSGKPTAWVSLVDGTDAPTQTLAYVSGNKASGFTSHKVQYVLATPKVEVVANKVDGALAVNDGTQVSVKRGIVYKEKVTPSLNGSGSHAIINRPDSPATLLRKNVRKYVSLHVNGKSVPINQSYLNAMGWYIETIVGSNGLTLATTSDRYDPQAVYEVTYEVLDPHESTASNANTTLTVDQSLKDATDTLVAKVADVTTATSVNSAVLVDILARLKALEG